MFNGVHSSYICHPGSIMASLSACIVIAARYPGSRSLQINRTTLKDKLNASLVIIEECYKSKHMSHMDQFYMMYFIGSIVMDLKRMDNLFEFTEDELVRINKEMIVAAKSMTEKNVKRCYFVFKDLSIKIKVDDISVSSKRDGLLVRVVATKLSSIVKKVISRLQEKYIL